MIKLVSNTYLSSIPINYLICDKYVPIGYLSFNFNFHIIILKIHKTFTTSVTLVY